MNIYESLFNYYGTDWAAMGFTLVGILMLGNKSKNGFIMMLFGNTSWFFFGVLSGSIATMLANVVFFVMNGRGYIKWFKERKKILNTTK